MKIVEFENRVDPVEVANMEHLISVYTVHSKTGTRLQ